MYTKLGMYSTGNFPPSGLDLFLKSYKNPDLYANISMNVKDITAKSTDPRFP
jgi:hypothetical protein